MKTKLFLLLLLTFFQGIFAQEITGSWKGELEIQGAKLPIIVHFQKNNSVYSGTLDSPNQGAMALTMDKVQINDHKIFFEIKKLNLEYNGVLKDEKIDGTFSQNGFSTNLSFDFFENKRSEIFIANIKEEVLPTVAGQINRLDQWHIQNVAVEFYGFRHVAAHQCQMVYAAIFKTVTITRHLHSPLCFRVASSLV